MRGNRALRRGLTGCACVLLAAAGHAADWKFDAGVTARETYTDNVRLSATARESDLITEINPFVTVRHEGARLKVDARYTMNNVFYLLGNADDRVNHQLGASLRSELIEDRFFFDATASYSQQLLSALGPLGVGNTATAAGNTTDVGVYTLTPYWKQRFGSFANAELRLSQSGTFFSSGALERSQQQRISAVLSSGADFKHPWSLGYSYATTTYQTRGDATFENVYGTLGYAITPRLRVNGTLGYENNDYATNTGKRPVGAYWNLGVSWRPSSRTSLDAGFGDHYWGNSWNLAFRHKRVSSDWTLTYSEAVSTTTSQLGSLQPNVVPPGGAVVGSGPLLNNAVSKNDSLRGSVSYRHGKSDYGLNVFMTRARSLDTQPLLLPGPATVPTNQVRTYGLGFDWNWRYSPLIRTTLRLQATHNRFEDLDRTDDYQLVEFGLTRRFNPHLSGEVRVRHQRRASDAANADYDESALIGGLTYTF